MPGRQRELRKSARKPKRQAAWISHGDGGSQIPCVLWDLSEEGARLAPARSNVVPDVFTLLMTRDGKLRRVCRVVWRKKPYIGVQFIEAVEDKLDVHLGRARRRAANSGRSCAEPAAHRPELIPALMAMPAQSLSRPSSAGPKDFGMSSLAVSVIVLLSLATIVFYAAGLQLDSGSDWAMEACSYARNFCEHPEFSGLPAAIMSVVYLSLRGMEL